MHPRLRVAQRRKGGRVNYHEEVCSDCLTCQAALAAERQRADNATDWGRKLFAACEEAGQRWAASSQRAERLEAALREIAAFRCSAIEGYEHECACQRCIARHALEPIRMPESRPAGWPISPETLAALGPLEPIAAVAARMAEPTGDRSAGARLSQTGAECANCTHPADWHTPSGRCVVCRCSSLKPISAIGPEGK